MCSRTDTSCLLSCLNVSRKCNLSYQWDCFWDQSGFKLTSHDYYTKFDMQNISVGICTHSYTLIRFFHATVAGRREKRNVVLDILEKSVSSQTCPKRLDIARRGRPSPKRSRLSLPGKRIWSPFPDLCLWAVPLIDVSGQSGFARLSCLSKTVGRHQAMAGHSSAFQNIWVKGYLWADACWSARFVFWP